MYNFFKTIAFQLDAEVAHTATVKSLGLLPSVFSLYGPLERLSKYQIETNIGSFSFPLGIAAGLDKNAELIDYFGRLGVGGLEVGTVTPKPQEGNDKPRLFRLQKDKSLRNCMGFNGEGATKVIANMAMSNSYSMKVGVNFGKNKVTSNDNAIIDYLTLFDEFKGHGDYYVINVSSPNTPGLRELQDKDFLLELSKELCARDVHTPVYLKISPDMEINQIKLIAEVVANSIYSGVIATNTSHVPKIGEGGVSGKLIREKSRNVRNEILSILSACPGKEVIGVGGVESIDDLWDFWIHGGKYMQVYTAFIYQGPKMFSTMAHKFDFLFEYFGVHSVEELIRLARYEKVRLPKFYK